MSSQPRLLKLNSVGEHLQKNALDNQNSYAKWLLASLVTVNGGAVISIAQLSNFSVQNFAYSVAWFFSGLVAALLAGAFTWVNFTFSFLGYAVFSTENDGLKSRLNFDIARYAGFVAIFFTGASIFAFACGGFSVWENMRRPSPCLGLQTGPVYQICKLFDSAR